MSLKMNSSPYQRSPRTTLHIMLELSAALLLVWIAAVIYNFTLSAELGLRAILLMVVALVTTAVIDAVVALIRHKKGNNVLNEVVDGVVHNYSYVTAIIFTLCCPVYVTYYVIIIGCLFSTGIKHCFGGFGKNIFNPAIIGRIVTGYFFAGAFTVPTEYVEADLMASSTVTSQYSALSGTASRWLSASLPEGFNIGNLLLGNYIGAMGETFTLLILVLGIFLVVRGVINWRSSAFYLGTVAVTAFVIGIFAEGVNPLTYTVYHLALGGLMFGAVFMITDPVTSPTSPFGKALIGVIAGFITVLFRMDSNNPEGVMYSIAIVNIIAPMIDRFVVGRTTDGHAKKWATIGGLVAASMLINTAISVGNVKALQQNNSSSSEVEESSSSTPSLSYEETLFGIENASYAKVTLGALEENSNIKNVYIASVKDVDTAICYELNAKKTWSSHGAPMSFEGTFAIAFNISDDTVLSVNTINVGTDPGFNDKAKTAASKLIGKEASVVASMTESSYVKDTDYVGGASKSGVLALNLSVEAAKQYINIDKLSYCFGVSAKFEKVENASLPTETNIKNVYVGKMEGLNNVVGYSLEKEVSWKAHGSTVKFNPNVYVAFDVLTDKILSVKVLNGGTDNKFNSNANIATSKLIGKEASVVATLVESSYVKDTDYVGGASKSGINALNLVVEAAKQYLNDTSLKYGYDATYELLDTELSTNIKKAYVGKVESTNKVVAYELEREVSWKAHGSNVSFVAKAIVVINLENEKIVSLSLSDCGTGDPYTNNALVAMATLLDKDVNDVSALTETDYVKGTDYVANATKSGVAALNLVVEAAQQFVNVDKVTLGGAL